MAALNHVLCVDDEDDILEIAKLCLETVGGLQVTTLNNGADALAKVESIKPDLILLDVMLPVMDGPTILQELRKNPALDHIPVVFMTARVQPDEIQEYINLGATGVVPKPFDPMALADQISAIWQKTQGL